jgi:hypothetical protein
MNEWMNEWHFAEFFLKADSRSADQEPFPSPPSLLWSGQIHCRIYKITPLDPIRSHLNPVHPNISGSILVLSSHTHTHTHTICLCLWYSSDWKFVRICLYPISSSSIWLPIFIKKTNNYEASRYVIFSISLLLYLRSKYFLQHSVLTYPLSSFFSRVDRTKFRTHIKVR